MERRLGPELRAWRAWNRWAFTPIDPAPMAVLRIVTGLVSLGWAISFFPDIGAFLANDGLVPEVPDYNNEAWAIDLGNPYLVMGALCAASVAMILGWHSRLSTVVVAVLLLVIQRRDPYILNSGDVLLRNLAFYVALMPSGETWSLDARRRKRPAQARAPWALRMLQIQVSIVYGAAVMAKLRGDPWNEGTAVGISLQLEDLQRFVVPEELATDLLFSTTMTYGTLVLETLLVFGLWFRRTRVPVALLGIMMHVGIDLTLAVGWFSYALIAAYAAFFPGADVRAAINRVARSRGWREVGPSPNADPPAPAAAPSTSGADEPADPDSVTLTKPDDLGSGDRPDVT